MASGYSWAGEDDLRRTVLEGRSVLERTSQSLARSQAVAAETETLGEEVISELGQQRETLLRTKRRLADTDEELVRSHSLLRKMALQVLTNKIILVVLILLEVAILGAIVYLRFIKH